jgi:hypothetical protein
MFNMVVGDTGVVTLPDTSLRLVHKPIDDLWTRQLKFRRYYEDTSAADTTHKGWRWHIIGTSGVTVTSANATTQIQSLRIQAGARDTTITDPLQLHRLHRMMWFPHDTPVTLTVTTGRANDIVVLYHSGDRRRFTSNGDNTYTLTFQDADFGGLRHFGVNAFSNGTLRDDVSPYDSQAWVLPFGARDHDCDVDRH